MIEKAPILTKGDIKTNAGYTLGNKVWDVVLDLLIDQRDADHKYYPKAILTKVRDAIAVEYNKAIKEARQEPFPNENLNKEHKLLWLGHANAHSETLSYLDALLKEAGRD